MAKRPAKNHIIDCDKPPRIFAKGFTVETHSRMGLLEWDPAKAGLFLAPCQKKEYFVKGTQILKELARKQPLNGRVLDYLLDHPELIPGRWKTMEDYEELGLEDDETLDPNITIFFWGTLYHRKGGRCVRYLEWDGQRWSSNWEWVGAPRFTTSMPAAIWSASSKKHA